MNENNDKQELEQKIEELLPESKPVENKNFFQRNKTLILVVLIIIGVQIVLNITFKIFAIKAFTRPIEILEEIAGGVAGTKENPIQANEPASQTSESELSDRETKALKILQKRPILPEVLAKYQINCWSCPKENICYCILSPTKTYPDRVYYAPTEVEYEVDFLHETATPYFEFLEESSVKETQNEIIIPNTDKTLRISNIYDIEINSEGTVEISGTETATALTMCKKDPDALYCQELYSRITQEFIEEMLNYYISIDIRTIETALQPEEWILDNIAYQGKLIRELMELYPEYTYGERVQIGNISFFKIREGCCGDSRVSYFYKDPKEDILIVFRERGSNQTALSEILSTVK